LARPEPGGPLHRAAILLATGFGTGYAPVASGTFGSLPGLLAIWLLVRFGGQGAAVAGTIVVALVGVWVAGVAERHFGREDPGAVVIDEIAGQMMTLWFIRLDALSLFLGFFFFRLMDTLKPPPARRLEALHGGAGIMADDLCAAVYAHLVLQLLRWLGWGVT
jgi:phosphatidylglycerophosphatase A